MNCNQAKQIPISYILINIEGRRPTKVTKDYMLFPSPFREEKDPSFKLDRNYNIWFDHGAGIGGNAIDLIMKLHNVGLAGALLLLQKPELSKQTFSFSQQQNSDSSIKIKHLQPLQNRALVQYLASRRISKAKAVNYVQEAYYQVNGKQYFALAFKNDKGGFELRNKYFKGSSSPKAITTIPGSRKVVSIFEGFTDFLSAIEFYQVQKPAGTCIVLNSVSNLDAILSSLTDYEKINLYLDNDKTGTQAAQKIKQTHSRARVTDFSKIIYPEHKDMNELLVQTKKSTLSI